MDGFESSVLNFSEIENLIIKKETRIKLTVKKEGVLFEFLLYRRNNSNKAIVFGSGAINRTKLQPPLFNRFSWIDKFDENCIYYNDPTLYLSDDLNIGWGYGEKDRHYLSEVGEILIHLYKKMKIHPKNALYYGSSAGGFQSLILASKLKGIAVVNNPQTKIENYYQEVSVK
ncbi:hypothetical protein [Alkalihalobacillus sp. 1P02AB]|uniref:hypothetical protein n=1 Tax=Alkalihalobacillus sp. 1P02AB TaxID=3132260 RepID=UPI0039A55998